MLDKNAVSDIQYLIGKQEERESEQEGRVTASSSAEDREAAVLAGKKVWQGKSYYDQESETDGVLWRPKLKSDVEAKLTTAEDGKKARVGRGRRLADGLESGGVVNTKAVRQLAMGFDPVTGEKLTAAADYHLKKQRYPEKITGKERVPKAGDDLTFSIDKPVSALWADAVARGDTKTATAIENAFRAAVGDAKQWMHDNEFFKTRRVIYGEKAADGKRERIEYLEMAQEVVTVDFLHRTTRPTGDGSSKGDPQLHIHALVMNMAVRADGTIGALDDSEIFHYRPLIDAVFKTSFYDRLRQIDGFEDIECVRGQYDVKLKGIKQEVVDSLSNRRAEIVEALAEKGLTTKDRRAAQVAAKATRQQKDEQPPIGELVPEWQKTIHKFTDGKSLISQLEAREKIEESRDEKIERIAKEAISRVGHTQTIVQERDVMVAAYRASQGEFGLQDMPEVISYIKQQHMIQAGFDDDGRALWGVRHLVDKEVSFLKTIQDTPSITPMASQAQIEEIIERYKPDPEKGIRGLNPEQVGGLRYVLGSQQFVTVFEGSAGSGKTFSMGLVKEVAEASGFEVYGIAPAWRAAGVLREDLELRDEMSKACAKWIAQHKVGKVDIDSNTVVIIDEAGMVGVEDAEYIVKAVQDGGGRVVMLGDTKQLAPVASGSPMSLAMRLNGSYRLNIIMRQNDDTNDETKRLTARFREASSHFVKAGLSGVNEGGKRGEEAKAEADAAGKKPKFQSNAHIEAALAIYNEEDRMHWCPDHESTYHAVADKYLELLAIEQDPTEVMIVTNRNSDVHNINREVRQLLIEAGMLGETEVEFRTYTRNNKEDEVGHILKVREGDRLIFGGRQLEPANTGSPFQINNSDMLSVKAIEIDPDGGEPTLHLVFDKEPDTIVKAKPSQLAAIDPFNDREPRPVLQHAYAVTVHASQGATVNRAIVANVNGIDYRLAYVGMTRHRKDCHMITNVGRIEENRMVKAGIVLVDDNGKMSIPHPEKQTVPEGEFQLGPEQWFQAVVYEASISDSKANFTDLEQYKEKAALQDFLANDNRFADHLTRLQGIQLDKLQNLENKIIDNKARLGPGGKIGASLAADQDSINNILEGTVQPFRDLKSSTSASQTMETLTPYQEDIMDQRMAANLRNRMSGLTPKFKLPTKTTQDPPATSDDSKAAGRPAQKIEKVSKRISDSEKQAFYKQDPVSFMLRNGARLDPDMEKKNTGERYHLCDGYDAQKKKPINKYTVSRMPDGNWVYNQFNDSGSKGLIDRWMVNKGVSTSFPAAWHKLREEFRTEHLQDTQIVAKPPFSEKPKSTFQAYKDTIAHQLAATSFKDDGRGLSGVDRLKEAIAKGAEADAAYADKLRGRLASKWMAAIENGAPETASPAEKYKAEKAVELLDKGASYYQFDFLHQKQTPWATDTYPKERGLERGTIVAFENDVKRDLYKDPDGKWQAGLCFAHRDVISYSTVTGYESKLPASKTVNGEDRRTTKFAEGGGKGLVMIGPKAKGSFDTVVVTESGIDCLSYWQEKKLPANFKQLSDTEKQDVASRVPKDTLMVATGGAVSDQAERGIELLAKANPQARFVIAMDNDFAGYAFREQVKEAVLKGNPKAEVRFEQPNSILYKDWNDQVRDKIRSPEDLQKSADKMGLTSDFIKREVAAYQQKNPTADLSGYQDIGSKAADEKAKQAALVANEATHNEQARVHIKDAPSIKPTKLPAFKPFKFQAPEKPAGISAEDVKRAEEARLKAEKEREEAERRRGAAMKM
ncbi:MobF family relaxase [Pseudorhizobium flavum]|uniref:MobF family relaxase n=1 Tax=Pseudorhizobium flavum TaxID=1335061 RepID=UPI00376FA694